MRDAWIGIALMASLCAPMSGQQSSKPDADRVNVERLLRSLAHDSMEGRGTGTPGGVRAAAFLASEMKKIGLTPFGDSGYYQIVPMVAPVPPREMFAAGTMCHVDTISVQGRGAAQRVAQWTCGAGVTGLPNLQPASDLAANCTATPTAPGAAAPAMPSFRCAAGRGGRARMITLRARSDLDTVPAARHRPAYNVVGMIPGADSKLKNEVILVLSHYDHLGIGAPQNGDSIYNGADDDASGTVAVLEVARHLMKGAKPRRTVVFANMTGEEVGLIGTNWFIEHPPIPLTNIVAGFEIEMIGRPDSLAGGPGKAWLTGYERSTMGDMLKANGIAIVPDKRPDQRFFMRSDNYGFARRGIVAHTLSTFNLHTDYHQASDDVDKVDFAHMTEVTRSAAAAVRHLANDPQKPAWHEGGKP